LAAAHLLYTLHKFCNGNDVTYRRLCQNIKLSRHTSASSAAHSLGNSLGVSAKHFNALLTVLPKAALFNILRYGTLIQSAFGCDTHSLKQVKTQSNATRTKKNCSIRICQNIKLSRHTSTSSAAHQCLPRHTVSVTLL